MDHGDVLSTQPEEEDWLLARTHFGEDWDDLPEPTPDPEETSEEDADPAPPPRRPQARRADYQEFTQTCDACQ